jgi:hypothetical protein
MCLWCAWKELDEQDLMEFIWQDLNAGCRRYCFLSDFCGKNSKKNNIFEGKIS